MKTISPGNLRHLSILLLLLCEGCSSDQQEEETKDMEEEALQVIHDVSTDSRRALCVTEPFRSLPVPLVPLRYESARQKTDMAAMVLTDLGVAHHLTLMDTLARSLLESDRQILASRILALNESTGHMDNMVSWRRHPSAMTLSSESSPMLEHLTPRKVENEGLRKGTRPDAYYPWYEDAHTSPGLRSPKFIESPVNVSFRGWWTFPYFSCAVRRWLISYSLSIPAPGRHGLRGFLSIDVDVSRLEINQCEKPKSPAETSNFVAAFHNTHKCERRSMECVAQPGQGWARGRYWCHCRQGFYTKRQGGLFDGTLVELAWHESERNGTNFQQIFRCFECAPGCINCTGPEPCLAVYNWTFRITLLSISCTCVLCAVVLVAYMYQHRKIKVFKVASPTFLSITLLGCAIMYLEMAAIFPVLDTYSCIATKWTRHLGFCVTYTALLMKTWRVSLTYRVKSAHKVKLTDKQLLQWMFPILLVMLIYLGTWTLSAPPHAEQIKDQQGLLFNQCTYNWWDHSLAIGEVLFLGWGIRVCYNVRHAESLYNEARLISYAIYNIALVNTAMLAFHLFIFPRAGPDIKYLLGFIRTQLSTTVTIALVFAPKVYRVMRGQGDQWDNRARARGVTASFSLNGIGLMPEETGDLYQENEELKEEIQKLAAQIEFMKIVHMEMNNRHLKPKPSSYFSSNAAVAAAAAAAATATTSSSGLQPPRESPPKRENITKALNPVDINEESKEMISSSVITGTTAAAAERV